MNVSGDRKPNISRLIEMIGLFVFSINDNSPSAEQYTDATGLTEEMCILAGSEDAEQQKTPQFLERFGKRDATLVRAYLRGYSSYFCDLFGITNDRSL